MEIFQGVVVLFVMFVNLSVTIIGPVVWQYVQCIYQNKSSKEAILLSFECLASSGYV